MISQQDLAFLQHATKNLPKDAVLESSDPFTKELHERRTKDVKPKKGVTAGAHVADTGHGLKPTAGMKGVKEDSVKTDDETITEKSAKLDANKKVSFKKKFGTGLSTKDLNDRVRKAKKRRDEGEEFDENNPEFANENNSKDAAKQGWGKKTLGTVQIRPSGSAGGAADQGHGKKSVQGSLERKEETNLDESTRKHFREVANTVRQIEDPKKRQEFADHHAQIFASQNPRFDHARFHEAAGTLHRKDEDIDMNEDGDAKGQGTHATGKETLGAVRIKADGSPGEAAAQGHGKKPVTGEICRDGHPGTASQGETTQGQGKKPIRGEICREDVGALIDAIIEEKPGEALEAFGKAIFPLVKAIAADQKASIQAGLLGIESVEEGSTENSMSSDVEVDVTGQDDNEKKVDDED